MADEIELVAVTTKASANVPVVPRDGFHLGLGQRGVVVILTVRAPTAASLTLIDLHGLAQRHPVGLVGPAFVGRLLRPKHPVADDGLRVLAILGRRDERLGLGDPAKDHHVICLPLTRSVNAVAADAMVEMNDPASSTWPTSSGQV